MEPSVVPHGGRALPELRLRIGLVEEVKRKMEMAIDEPTDRRAILQDLFTDVALDVDDRAKAHLFAEFNDIGSDFFSSSKGPLCFYEILAEHFVCCPEDAEDVLPLFLQLWSQYFTCMIFALLMHQWLYDDSTKLGEDIMLRYSKGLINGADHVFWIDVQSNMKRFSRLYTYILNEIVLSSEGMIKVPVKARKDLVLLVSRFYFFYEGGENLHAVLNHLSRLLPSGECAAADTFVNELTNQLQKIKVEPVLLEYISCAKNLKGLDLWTSTSIRLQAALYAMTSPGGPHFPPRSVRHAAFRTLDCLYPVGRRFRHLISLGFRLLHPYYWPSSFWHFLVTKVNHVCDGVNEWIRWVCRDLFGWTYHELRDVHRE
ncbi:hypothetical protein CBR_g46654 [Chara braunii]|uniref:Uncharacterized protein n=1 Tax=Chara braunii TaxID=69332 RepID=A0A388M0T9_CHABU|nr:hypothetical protein CBR_g46654 [Chara braunii]|eukprot:GBG88166.1 hypothetical protein CBR_g46654 [Chara braunii]